MTRKRHPAARRKHGDTEPLEDPFLGRILEAWAWTRLHSRALVIGIAGAALLVAGTLYYTSYRKSLRVQAAEELERIQQTADAGGVQIAKNELQTFLSRFANTSHAREARLVLGQLHLRTGNTQEAVQVLEPAAQDLDHPLSLQAAFLLATAYEDAGRTAEALPLYLRITHNAELTFQQRDALAAAARLRAAQNDFAGARDLYSRILALLPENDPQRAFFELRLAEAQTRAHSHSPSSP